MTLPKTPSSSLDHSQQLSLVSFNIFAIATRSSKEIALRIAQIIETKFLEEFDVLVFQEVFTPGAVSQLKTGLTSRGYIHWSGLIEKGCFQVSHGGVLIASRTPFTSTPKAMRFRSRLLPDSLAAKGALYAPISKGQHTFHIFGLHTQADSAFFFPKCRVRPTRAKQFTQLQQWLHTLNIPPSQPVIFAGDMNVDRSKTLKPDTEFCELLDRLNVTEVKRVDDLYSYDPTKNPLASGPTPEDLDHIFTSNDHLAPNKHSKSQVFIPPWPLPQEWPKLHFSDHFPISAHLDFSNEK